MAIWFQPLNLDVVQKMNNVNMMKHLGIEVIEFGDDYLKGRMPVDHRTQQPFGILHGGASVALAETLGSNAANLCLNPMKAYAVGLSINASHMRAVRSGYVYGTACPHHLGRSTHVWEIKIVDENDRLICVSRLTMAVITR